MTKTIHDFFEISSIELTGVVGGMSPPGGGTSSAKELTKIPGGGRNEGSGQLGTNGQSPGARMFTRPRAT